MQGQDEIKETVTTRGQTLGGTSGWRYSHWRDVLYPAQLDPREWISEYAREFSTVEISSSSFGLLEPADIEDWCERTPEDFRFAVIAPRRITYQKKLRNCASDLDALLANGRLFAQRLGPIVFQFPSGWRANLYRLEPFLELLPEGFDFVFDFRDPSWHSQEVIRLLETHNASFCIYQLHGYLAPLEVAGPVAYIRLHGPGGSPAASYRGAALRSWVSRARGWNRAGKDVYVYFDNDVEGYAVKNARRFVSFLREGPILPGKPVLPGD